MPEIITDTELVKKFTQQIVDGPKEEPAEIETVAPFDSTVTLPGGYVTHTNEVITSAEVRELNGEDEEIIAKAGSISKSLATVLRRGIVKIGNQDATSDSLDQLLSGDRDAILIAIRKATFGEKFPLIINCPHCNEKQNIDINLSKDVPVVKLKNKEDRTWITKTRVGNIKITLPTGAVQKKLMDNMDKTVAEINTLLLSNCILSVNDSPVIGQQVALSLGMADRARILQEILDKNPGPRLGEVKKDCKACGEKIDLPLSLADLFLL